MRFSVFFNDNESSLQNNEDKMDQTNVPDYLLYSRPKLP